jgi:DMSO/TMAO reductase YedYZ heme-binding membrane subunit
MLDQLYPFVLALHNAWRWLTLFGVLAATLVSLHGWLAGKRRTPADDRVTTIAVLIMDVQLVLGLTLYVALSPLSRAMFTDPGAAMQNRDVRFFGMEHPFLMILAIAAVHAGKAGARKHDATPGFRAGAIWYALSLLLMLAGTPWWRPLLRGF